MVVSTCCPFIGKSFPYISCLSLHGLREESTQTTVWRSGQKQFESHMNSCIIITVSSFRPLKINSLFLILRTRSISPDSG